MICLEMLNSWQEAVSSSFVLEKTKLLGHHLLQIKLTTYLVGQSCFVTLGFELILKKLLLQKPFYYCMMYYPDGKSNILYYS